MNNLTAFQKYTALSHHQVFLTHPPCFRRSSMCCVKLSSIAFACILQSIVSGKPTHLKHLGGTKLFHVQTYCESTSGCAFAAESAAS